MQDPFLLHSKRKINKFDTLLINILNNIGDYSLKKDIDTYIVNFNNSKNIAIGLHDLINPYDDTDNIIFCRNNSIEFIKYDDVLTITNLLNKLCKE
jgi:hypothetical protein